MCCGGTHCEVSQANIENATKKLVELCGQEMRVDERKKVLEEVEGIMRTHIKSSVHRKLLAKIADEIQELKRENNG